jgi:hypothetical protein
MITSITQGATFGVIARRTRYERARRGVAVKLFWPMSQIQSWAFVSDVRGGRRRSLGQGSHGMTRYLISFDDGAMTFPEEELPAVGEAAHAVVRAAQEEGVWIFGGGVETQRASIVAPDGTVTDGPYPETKAVIGGFAMIDVPSREKALEWAAKFAVACRCAQEVREIMFDPLV